MIRITAKQDGFRRCGLAHPSQATEHANDAFTAAELKTLQSEPMLMVQITEGTSNPGKPQALNVAKTVELVQAAATIEELDKLAVNEERKGVMDAIAKRRSELGAPEE